MRSVKWAWADRPTAVRAIEGPGEQGSSQRAKATGAGNVEGRSDVLRHGPGQHDPNLISRVATWSRAARRGLPPSPPRAAGPARSQPWPLSSRGKPARLKALRLQW